jgi:hypothetical protein
LNSQQKIEDKVYNIELVVEEIKKFPQTYNTILETSGLVNNTLQTILRRKLNKLCKQGIVYKTSIPGTRFGKVIFYHKDKEYIIFVVAGRVGSDVFVTFKTNKIENTIIQLDRCWILDRGLWREEENVRLHEGKVLLII